MPRTKKVVEEVVAEVKEVTLNSDMQEIADYNESLKN